MFDKTTEEIANLLSDANRAGMNEDWPLVISLANAALRLDPRNVSALKYRAMAMSAEKDNVVSGLLDDAEKAAKEKNWSRVISLSDAVLELEPSNFVAYHLKRLALGDVPWNEDESVRHITTMLTGGLVFLWYAFLYFGLLILLVLLGLWIIGKIFD